MGKEIKTRNTGNSFYSYMVRGLPSGKLLHFAALNHDLELFLGSPNPYSRCYPRMMVSTFQIVDESPEQKERGECAQTYLSYL